MHPVNFFVIFFIIECASFPSSFRKRCVFVLNLSCQLFATLWSRLLCLPDFPSNNTGLCYHFLLQRICPTQGLNLYLIHWQAECLPRNHLGSQQADGGGGGLVAQSQPTLVAPWTVACQAPLSMGFPRQEYWSGLPFLLQGKKQITACNQGMTQHSSSNAI